MKNWGISSSSPLSLSHTLWFFCIYFPSSPSLLLLNSHSVLCLIYVLVFWFFFSYSSKPKLLQTCTDTSYIVNGHGLISVLLVSCTFLCKICVCVRERACWMYLCLDLVQSLPGLCFCAVCVWQCYPVLNRQWVLTYPETTRLLTHFISNICSLLGL